MAGSRTKPATALHPFRLVRMVRMMALSEYKQFLSFADLARYINENENIHYDVFEYADRKRFIGLLLHLIRENKLKPFFSYDGMVQVEIISQDTASEKNITKYSTNFYGYALFPIGLYPKFFRSISENEATELKYSGEVFPYDFQTRTEYINLGERDSISYQISSEENFSFTIHDLYYLKSDLDHLFKKNSQVDNAETVRQLQAELEKIKQEKLEAIQGYKDAYSDYLAKYKQEVSMLKGHLEQQVKDKQKTIDQQADQIEYLKNQLEQQTNQLSSAAEADENSRTQDPKIIAMMAILLAGKQDIYKWGDKPNRSKIEAQIKNLIDTQLYIDSKHTHGLEAASKRIGKCLDDFSEYFYTLPKPNFEK